LTKIEHFSKVSVELKRVTYKGVCVDFFDGLVEPANGYNIEYPPAMQSIWVLENSYATNTSRIPLKADLYWGLKIRSHAWAIRMVIIINGNAVFMKPIKLIL